MHQVTSGISSLRMRMQIGCDSGSALCSDMFQPEQTNNSPEVFLPLFSITSVSGEAWLSMARVYGRSINTMIGSASSTTGGGYAYHHVPRIVLVI